MNSDDLYGSPAPPRGKPSPLGPLLLLAIVIGSFCGVAIYLSLTGIYQPTIDGNYNEAEWKGSKFYNHGFWLDVNNSIDTSTGTRNVDGWNYISIGSDADYYYIGLDLCSDRTNNVNGEWISYYLANRMPDFTSLMTLHALRDHGSEFIMYNVSSDSEFDRDIIMNDLVTTHYYDIPIVEPDTVNVYSGNTSDTYDDYWSDDYSNYTIKSESGSNIYNGAISGVMTGEEVILELGINITEKFPEGYETDFFGNMTTVEAHLLMGGNLTSVDYMLYSDNTTADEMVVWFQPNSEYKNVSDPMFENGATGDWIPFTPNDETSYTLDVTTSVNPTTGMLYLTLVGYNELNATNETAFEIYINKMSLSIRTQDYSHYVDTSVASSNYDIAWGFGSSPNCAEAHRMFELRVSKSEFPDVPGDTLYLFIDGYGTMAIEDSDFWIFPNTYWGFFGSYINGFPTSSMQFIPFDLS